jgi:hypothetical protein
METLKKSFGNVILAIDPGPSESAFIFLSQDKRILGFGKIENEELLECFVEWFELFMMRIKRRNNDMLDGIYLAVEMVSSYGMAVGDSVFETCVWVGRFIENYYNHCAFYRKHHFVYRKKRKEFESVCMNLCNSTRAKDKNVRQALIDLYGGDSAIGLKKSPGPLYGISGDVWSALAVGVTFIDGFLFE